ncbi:DNA methyltransferase [Halobaculum sp. EA56]|uniref:DNA methyltransferase n=1 Tax=Halobaculum sp. EA56 TaxID=3421648 RepID=UPI003EBEE102
MDTHLTLEFGHRDPLPPGHSDEVRTPDVLVERFLEEYTVPGDRVLDPFAGFGTTLTAAERMGRVPFGVEFEPGRVAAIRDRLGDEGEVRRGSALHLDGSWFPPCDCCFTSPPFMTHSIDLNPFENYAGETTYGEYLDDVETAFRGVRSVLAPGGTVLVDVVNVREGDHVTPLAFDVADRVSDVFRFDGEVVIEWEGDGYDGTPGNYGYGFDHSYCLVFEKEREA